MFNWQDKLNDFILNKKESALDDSILKGVGELNPLESMTYYQNSYEESVLSLLRSKYSIFKRRIGEKDFEAIILNYISRFPSNVSSLDDYGDTFPNWLKGLSSIKNEDAELALFEHLVETIESSIPHQGEQTDIDTAYEITGQNYMTHKSQFDLISLWNDAPSATRQPSSSFYQLIYYQDYSVQVISLDKWQFSLLKDLQKEPSFLESVIGYASDSSPEQITDFFTFLTKNNLISNIN